MPRKQKLTIDQQIRQKLDEYSQWFEEVETFRHRSLSLFHEEMKQHFLKDLILFMDIEDERLSESFKFIRAALKAAEVGDE